jgi:hypothetical protein
MDFPKYVYRGDKLTDASFKNVVCEAIRRSDGRCITSKKATILLKREIDGLTFVGLRRQLRKIPKNEHS